MTFLFIFVNSMIESGHAQFTWPYRTFKSSLPLPRITSYSFLSFYWAVINYQKWKKINSISYGRKLLECADSTVARYFLFNFRFAFSFKMSVTRSLVIDWWFIVLNKKYFICIPFSLTITVPSYPRTCKPASTEKKQNLHI